MEAKEFAQLAGRLMRQPAAPCHEDLVQAEVRRICLEHGFKPTQDRFGNFLIRLQTDSRLRPVALSAHMDHPGFEVVRQPGRGKWIVRFQGGVPDEYFRSGLPLRLMPGSMPGRLGSRIGKDRRFRLNTRIPATAKRAFAVWELEDFALLGGRIHGRACDDLIGVASILATLIDLRRQRARCNVIGIISRAEEIGFLGALALAGNRGIPANALVVSLETSRELPSVKMGAGVIIRVGDRASIFDSRATRYLSEVASAHGEKNKSFKWQRALMAGGTCEATAYQELGFQTCAVCVALGNYHNCGPGGRIAEEFVSLDDACSMVELLVEVARQMPQYERLVGKLAARIQKLRAQAIKALR